MLVYQVRVRLQKEGRPRKSIQLQSAADVAAFMRPRLSGLDREQFHVLHLNAKNWLMSTALVSVGHLTGALVHPREAFKVANQVNLDAATNKSRALAMAACEGTDPAGYDIAVRDTFADAISRNVASVIFVHNHPSGSPEPSREDFDLTRRLVRCGEILGIPVADHVVVADSGYVSIAERGW